jgi:hypothetical protein
MPDSEVVMEQSNHLVSIFWALAKSTSISGKLLCDMHVYM